MDNGKERYFNGIFSSFTYAGTSLVNLGNKPATFVVYHASLVPAMWLLTRRSDCRIFQKLDVMEIIKEVFKPYSGLSIENRIEGSLAKREYCVQYRETDFNFVSRLLEEEGICYFFKHKEKQHTIVFANHSTKFKPCDFDSEPSSSQQTDAGHIREWVLSQEVRPGKYELRDFNFEQPRLDLTADADGTDSRKFQLYDYPGEYTKKDIGTKIAQTRMEEEDLPRIVVDGTATFRGFESGSTFKLKDHFRSEFNVNYLITAISHSCDQGDNYRSSEIAAAESFTYDTRFQCIPQPTPFRPPRITPEPVIHGTQTAIVVGPSGEEIYTDKYGRVKVQFHWDRLGKDDDNSSCWIRVSQPWAGNRWGAIWIPRIGQEVIVDFLEGDPDQPIITGRVYNADQMPPYQLPDNKTRSTFLSRSSKNGSSSTFNEVRFEDLKGSEQVFINAEKDMDLNVENDSREHVGNNRSLIVDKDQMESVGGDLSINVTGNINEKAGQNVSLQIGQNLYEKSAMNFAHEAGQEIHLKAGMNVVIEAGLELTIQASGNFINIGPAGISIVGTMVLINSGGAAGVGSPSTPTDPTDPDKADDGSKGTKLN